MKGLIKKEDVLNMTFSEGVTDDGRLYVPFREVIDNVRNLPVVEAIPIEYIKWYIDLLEGTGSPIRARGVSEMLKEWERQK